MTKHVVRKDGAAKTEQEKLHSKKLEKSAPPACGQTLTNNSLSCVNKPSTLFARRSSTFTSTLPNTTSISAGGKSQTTSPTLSAPLLPPQNFFAPLTFNRSDITLSDFASATGENRTETASSILCDRSDKRSAEETPETGARNPSLASEEVNHRRPPVTPNPNPPERGAPDSLHTHAEEKPNLAANSDCIHGTAKAAANGDLKQKLYYGADSSFSENVSPLSTKDRDATSKSLQAGSSASPPEPEVNPMPPQQTNTTGLASDYRVGDVAPVLVKGFKYVFDNNYMRWKTHDITVRILHPNRGVGQDDYFAYFAAELLDPIKAAVPMLAKVYRHNIADVAEADYFSLGQAQALAEEFARDYTSQKPRAGYTKYHLPLLTNRVVVRLNMNSILDLKVANASKGFFSYRTQDTQQMMFFMEPNTVACKAVGASFTSPEVDEGKCYPCGDPAWPRQVYSDIADGLSHFSLVQSREKMVIHGLMRTDGYLIDPLFHTTDREGFRMGDGGKKAIELWKKQHRCGDTCRALGIRSFNEDAVDISAAAAFNPLANTENHYTDYLRSVRQIRVVVRISLDVPEKPGEGMESDFESISQKSLNSASATDAAPATPAAPMSCPVTVNAIKYVFLPSRSVWEEVPMRMTVLAPNKPDAADDRNACFAIEEIHEGAAAIPMWAKFILRPGARDADYYHIGDAYCVCVALGQVFRGYRKNGTFERELEFRAAYAVRISQTEIPDSIRMYMRDDNFFARTTADSGDVVFVVEPDFQSDVPRRLASEAEMLRDADGFDDRELREVVDTFSHFTMHKSGNHLLVCDLKCKDGQLTQPHINTSNGRGFETINDGERGIRHWMKNHRCNPLCELLGMEPLPPQLKLYNISNSRLMKYINLVQHHALEQDKKVDFNLPSREPLEMTSRYGSEQHQTHSTGMASLLLAPAASAQAQPLSEKHSKHVPCGSVEHSHFSSGISTAETPLVEPPLKGDGDLLLRPWLRACKAAIPLTPTKKKGVLDSGPRRPLTQAVLSKLQGRGIETKYIIPATKYEYDISTFSWKMRRMFVRVVAPERGIGQGGMRVCFEVTDIDPEECEETVMVAKMYRRTIKDVVEKDYFIEVAAQKLASLFVKDFNAEEKEGCDVWLNVLDSAVIAIERADLVPELLAKKTGFFSYRTTDSQRLMFSVEARLESRFTKYNGNMGEAYPSNESRLSPAAARERTKIFEAVEALSHYSLVKSEGGLLVCDMQGVKNDLTDLVLHTYDGQGLGIGNFGARGIEKFIECHRCTPVCKALHLESLRGQKFEVTDTVKANNKFVRIFERSKEIEKMH